MQTFSNPATFVTRVGKAILFHGKEITTDVIKAVAYWEGKDFFHFGEMVGRIAEICITIPKPSLSSESIAFIDFVEHFWFHAFGIHMQVDQCQSGIQTSLAVINEAVELMELGHMAQAVTYLIAKIPLIKNAFNQCSEIAPDFNRGLGELMKLLNFKDFIEGTMKAFEHNPFDFSKNSLELAMYLVIRDWPHIGDTAGEVVMLILQEIEKI